ncbi:MAG: hypothetical protein OER86_14105, partial [Phycisphaerae bacterium]|nr:hypothetical protein [Phycisphaerae bacterium]
KAFVLTVLVTLGVRGQIAWWQVGALVLRDVAVAIAVSYAAITRDWAAFQRMPSRLAGKLTTVGLFIFLVVVILWPQARPAALATFALTAACSAWAAAVYLLYFARGVAEKHRT